MRVDDSHWVGLLAPLQLEAAAHTAEESSDELVQKLLRGEVQVRVRLLPQPFLCSFSRRFACDAARMIICSRFRLLC